MIVLFTVWPCALLCTYVFMPVGGILSTASACTIAAESVY